MASKFHVGQAVFVTNVRSSFNRIYIGQIGRVRKINYKPLTESIDEYVQIVYPGGKVMNIIEEWVSPVEPKNNAESIDFLRLED